jgi:ABC transport system ATP-binding/permease protein
LTPTKALSGGECNRLLLARLFSQPANVLVLDEPTNDLDLETLELLEELLSDYQGTLLLVSHDRTFIDNVVTSMLIFTGAGQITEYIGGYNNWQHTIKQTSKVRPETIKNQQEKSSLKQQKKLSYKEQKELDDLPKLIENIEAEKNKLEKRIADPEFYKQNANSIKESMNSLQQLESSLRAAFIRWEELEKICRSNY